MGIACWGRKGGGEIDRGDDPVSSTDESTRPSHKSTWKKKANLKEKANPQLNQPLPDWLSGFSLHLPRYYLSSSLLALI